MFRWISLTCLLVIAPGLLRAQEKTPGKPPAKTIKEFRHIEPITSGLAAILVFKDVYILKLLRAAKIKNNAKLNESIAVLERSVSYFLPLIKVSDIERMGEAEQLGSILALGDVVEYRALHPYQYPSGKTNQKVKALFEYVANKNKKFSKYPQKNRSKKSQRTTTSNQNPRVLIPDLPTLGKRLRGIPYPQKSPYENYPEKKAEYMQYFAFGYTLGKKGMVLLNVVGDTSPKSRGQKDGQAKGLAQQNQNPKEESPNFPTRGKHLDDIPFPKKSPSGNARKKKAE